MVWDPTFIFIIKGIHKVLFKQFLHNGLFGDINLYPLFLFYKSVVMTYILQSYMTTDNLTEMSNPKQSLKMIY